MQFIACTIKNRTALTFISCTSVQVQQTPWQSKLEIGLDITKYVSIKTNSQFILKYRNKKLSERTTSLQDTKKNN
jgi:hypothetical protein